MWKKSEKKIKGISFYIKYGFNDVQRRRSREVIRNEHYSTDLKLVCRWQMRRPLYGHTKMDSSKWPKMEIIKETIDLLPTINLQFSILRIENCL